MVGDAIHAHRNGCTVNRLWTTKELVRLPPILVRFTTKQTRFPCAETQNRTQKQRPRCNSERKAFLLSFLLAVSKGLNEAENCEFIWFCGDLSG